MMRNIIGIDFGGTIASENDLEYMPGAIQTIKFIQETSHYRPEIHIISRVRSDDRATFIRRWLKVNDFWRRTGVSSENLIFCRERQEKATICKWLNVNIFIDNRLEVLSHMLGIVRHRIAIQPDDSSQFVGVDIYICQDWFEVEALILTIDRNRK